MAFGDVVQAVSDNSGNTFRANISLTLPVAPTAGNLLVFLIAPDKNPGLITQPAGFQPGITLLGNSISYRIAYKISDGSESGALTASWPNSSITPSAFLIEFEGPFNAGSLIAGSSVPAYSDTSVTSVSTGTTGTLTTPNCLAVALCLSDSGSNQGVTSWTNSFVEQIVEDGDNFSSSGAVATLITSATTPLETTMSHDGTGDQMTGGMLVFAQDGGEPGLSTDFSLTGGVTGTTANIKGKLSGASTAITVEYADNVSFTNATTTGVLSTDADFLVSASLSGLSADQSYWYRYRDNGSVIGNVFQFSTIIVESAYSYNMGFGSCYEQSGSPTTYARMQARNIKLLQSLGDTPYIDSSDNTGDTQKADFFTHLSATPVRALTDTTAYSYMWSDHDYQLNDSDSSSNTRTVMQALYRQIFPNYALPVSDSIYYAYTVGRVRHLVMDLRSERTGSTFLAATQMTWLKDELTAYAANASLVAFVLHSDVPWIAASGSDSWFGASAQRTEIVDHILSLSIEGQGVITCGDAHMLAADDGTNSAYGTGGLGGMPVFHGSAFNQNGSTKGGPYSEGTFSGSGQYGILEFVDSGASIDITFRGYNSSDTELVSYTHTVAGGAAVNRGIRTDSIMQPNVDVIVADVADGQVRAIGRDAIGGAEVFDVSSGSITNGIYEIDSNSVGTLNSTGELELRWTVSGESRYVITPYTVIDLDA